MTVARILFVNHTSTISGAERVLLDVAEAWRGCSIVLFEEGALERAMRRCGVKVIMSGRGASLAWVRRDGTVLQALPILARVIGLVFRLVKAARQHEVVYANSQKAFVLAALARLAVRCPLVWHLHDIISAAHFGGWQRWLQVTLANRMAALVLVPSQAAADAFVAAGGRQDLVHVVPNGIDLAAEPTSREKLREELGLPQAPLIGVFSRLAEWKGQHVVLEALARVPEVHCVLAGGALFGEQAYADRLQARVAELGLGDRVRFLGQREDVPRLMQAVDIVVHPSIDPEPFGRTLVEAMLVRTPVIATDAGASVDILDGGAAGTLIPPNDPEALAAAVSDILSRPARLDVQLDRAARRARDRYGVAGMQARIACLVEGVVRSGAP
jgi:glycosyltransferase involved in cell wall biosynthesis